jgi:hypothetical protein
MKIELEEHAKNPLSTYSGYSLDYLKKGDENVSK